MTETKINSSCANSRQDIDSGKVPSSGVMTFPPYRFNGTTCRSEDELIRAFLANPELGIQDLERGILAHHYFIISEKKGELCEATEKLIEHSNDKVRDFVNFLFKLAPDSDGFGFAIFGNGEYEFKNANEFLKYIEDLAKKDNYHEICHLNKSYGKALKTLSLKAWPSETYRRLEEMANSTILFGDHIFRDDKALAEYLEGKISANKNTPLNLKNFVIERKSVLLKLQERPELTDVIGQLMEFEEFEEREDYVITVDGVKYAPFQKGSFITFGKYPQGADGEIAPIEWQVLAVSANEALLISRYGLESFSDSDDSNSPDLIPIKWETSKLRRWLNGDFLKEAFSEDEVQRIREIEIPNFGSREKKCTNDRVFCLSLEEANHFLDLAKENHCQLTDYARRQGGRNDSYNLIIGGFVNRITERHA